VQRVLVGFGVDRNGFDTEFASCHDHAQGYLAAVGYQYLLEHEFAYLKSMMCASIGTSMIESSLQLHRWIDESICGSIIKFQIPR
jgi:hypothetical protein